MPRGRPRTRPVRTTQVRKYFKSKNFTRVKIAENKRLRAESREEKRAAKALFLLNRPQKRKYTRREKTAANALLTL